MPSRVSFKRKRSKTPSARKVVRRKTIRPTRVTPFNGVRLPMLGSMPRQMRSTLRYMRKAVNLDGSTGGLAATHTFSANGMFDPDITGAGHQPLGFDQIMQFYNHYTVVAARVYVSMRSTDATNRIICGVTRTGASSFPTDPERIVENGNCSYKYLNPAGNEGESAELYLATNIGWFLGRTDVLDDPDCKGIDSSNPGEQVYFTVWAAPDASVDPTNVSCGVVVEYDAVFHEPVQVTKS